MNSIAPTTDVVDITTSSGRVLAAWASVVRSSTWTIALDQRDPAARRCAPWCTEVEADDAGTVAHLAAAAPEDRRCASAPAAVPLAHHRGALSLEPGAGICPAVVEVSLTQRHDAAEPVVEVEVRSWCFVIGAGDVAVTSEPLRLRPLEVRQLVGLLTAAADAASTGTVR